jgi:hypothetical protein
LSLTTGVFNTALGGQALHNDTTGSTNTAVGLNALFFNNGSGNVAVGSQALQSNTTGFHNTADGFQALFFNTTGNHNTADGDVALHRNTTGNFNTASGAHTLVVNTTGSSNIALGFNAGENLTTGSNNIDIGNTGVAGEADTIRIGAPGLQARAFIAGIRGVAVTGSTVVVNAAGQLGVLPSSQRFKTEIKPMDKASEAILALKPVTFRYKQDVDPTGTPQFGLIAEDVEKVSPNLVGRDLQGELNTVRYEAVNAMLLNEFLKEHSEVQELKKQVAALTAGLQKVSAQLEASKPAPQTVLNDQ